MILLLVYCNILGCNNSCILFYLERLSPNCWHTYFRHGRIFCGGWNQYAARVLVESQLSNCDAYGSCSGQAEPILPGSEGVLGRERHVQGFTADADIVRGCIPGWLVSANERTGWFTPLQSNLTDKTDSKCHGQYLVLHCMHMAVLPLRLK